MNDHCPIDYRVYKNIEEIAVQIQVEREKLNNFTCSSTASNNKGKVTDTYRLFKNENVAFEKGFK